MTKMPALLSGTLALLAFTATVGAAPLPMDVLAKQSARSCPQAPATDTLTLPVERQAGAVVLYTLPADQVPAGAKVAVEVAVGGKPYLAESFVFAPQGASQDKAAPGSQLVFELFDTESEERGELLQLPPASPATVSIQVDGRELRRMSVAELLAASAAARKLGIVPTAVASTSSRQARAAEVLGFGGGFPVCGDGICEATANPAETCQSCLADCADLCYCGDGSCFAWENCGTCPTDCGPCCPTSLPNQQYYEVLTDSGTEMGSACFQGWRYVQYLLIYKLTTVSRVLECDGSVTETPILVQYGGTTCFQSTGEPCEGGFPSPPDCVF